MEIGIAPTMEPVWMNQNFVYSKWVQLRAQNGGESQKDDEKWFQAGSKMLQSGTPEIVGEHHSDNYGLWYAKTTAKYSWGGEKKQTSLGGGHIVDDVYLTYVQVSHFSASFPKNR